MRNQFVGDLGERRCRGVEFSQLRDLQALVAARIDPAERGQVHVHIEAQAVVGRMVADAQTQRGDLACVDVDAGRILVAMRVDAILGQGIDDGGLDPAHHLADAVAAPLHAQQQVDHQLARAMIGDLAAAVGPDQRDVGLAQQVFGLAGEAEGIDRWMFDDPQRVGRVSSAGVGERLHVAPDGFVIGQAEVANLHSWLNEGGGPAARASACASGLRGAKAVGRSGKNRSVR